MATQKINSSIIQQLVLAQDNIVKKDIAAWRRAHQSAINVENPKRIDLYNIYDYTVDLDTQVEGVKLQAKLDIMQKKFRLVDKKGKEVAEKTEILESTWFKVFMDLALESYYYGHSLIELRNMTTIADKPVFTDICLIPRKNVCPEYGVILREASDDANKGIPYRGNFPNMLIEVGQANDLGKYLKVCPPVISKKNAQIFWDDFAERFGIPVVVATTKTRDEVQQKRVSTALKNLGSMASITINDDITISPVQVNTSDAFEVFDRRIIRAEAQIATGLAGQTMTSIDGSSRSQAEVHERAFQKIVFSMADMLKDVINDKLLPLLILNGFPLEGLRFSWDDAYEYTPDQINKAEVLALQHYEVDPAYFIEKYGIPIIGKKKNNELSLRQDDFFA